MTRTSEKLVVVAALMVALVVVGAIGLRWFIDARSTAAQNSCINYLRQIDGAKQQWAYENRKTTNDVPTWEDIRPYLGYPSYAARLHCPLGGTYTIGRVGEPPRCSYPGHSIP
jgi:hypothetical protein